MYCIGCGEENPEGARFCSQCGTPLARRGQRKARRNHIDHLARRRRLGEPDDGDESDADAAALDTPAAGTALLVVRRGPNAGSRFLLDSDLTLVGRHPDSDIFLDDVTVSRRHAEFYRAGSRFTVRDVGSLNGTYVNRERIEEMDLTGGDEVQIGKFRLVFLPVRARRRTLAAEAPGRGMSATASPGVPRHRRGPGPSSRRVPRHQRVQDPVPGVGRADRARPRPRRLPPVRPGRRGAAPLHPDRAAGPVPAAAGDQGTARLPARRAARQPVR